MNATIPIGKIRWFFNDAQASRSVVWLVGLCGLVFGCLLAPMDDAFGQCFNAAVGGSAFQSNGEPFLLSVVNGGGVTSATSAPLGSPPSSRPPALNTNQVAPNPNGVFGIKWLDAVHFNLVTPDGIHFVTVVNGGGITGSSNATVDNIAPIHSDGLAAQGDSIFIFCTSDGGKHFTLTTPNSVNIVTAQNGGNMSGSNDLINPIHTDATVAKAWEQLLLVPLNIPAPAISSPGGICPATVSISEILPGAQLLASVGSAPLTASSGTVSLAGQNSTVTVSAAAQWPNGLQSQTVSQQFDCTPQVYDRIAMAITTGNDDLKSGTELTGTVTTNAPSGTQSFCLHASEQLSPDSICNGQNGPILSPKTNGSLTQNNGSNNTWNNFTSTTESFEINLPQTSASGFQNLTLNMIQSGCGLGADNWDLQSLVVTAWNSKDRNTPVKTILNVSGTGGTCFTRLHCSSPQNTVTYNLNGSNQGNNCQ
jgi:hypothetical protein